MTDTKDTAQTSERRRHLRIVLKAFPSNCTCQYTDPGGSGRTAQLVDISPGGARLRTMTAPPSEKDIVSLDCAFLKRDDIPAAIESVVRWTTDSEFGIAFSRELPLSTSDLQRIVDS